METMAQPRQQPQPQPQPQKAFPVSWDQFHRDARALAWRLSGAGPFAAIVCVTRGGLVPAAIVARELGIRLIETVCVSSYNHITQGELNVLKDVAESIVGIGGGRGKGVLIVDDLVDTGKTANGCRHAQVADIRRSAFARRAPRQHGMAADPLSRLRGQDAVVRPRERARYRADALCARRRASRP